MKADTSNPGAKLNYTKLFDPDAPAPGASPSAYHYNDDITLAVNVALATERPILVSGPSGCGKSSLASDIARVLGWSFESEVVTSRTQAIDLLYRVDHLRQLQDTRGTLGPMKSYITPGVLWRAFDAQGASQKTGSQPPPPPGTPDAAFSIPPPGKGVVVLIDEIDKADPDLPNNLLEAFGSYHFRIEELQTDVYARNKPLLVVTTNDERRLPDAFIRRCVERKIEAPAHVDTLVLIAQLHFPAEIASYLSTHPGSSLLQKVAKVVIQTPPWSTAEYLDTLRAIFHLGLDETDRTLEALVGITVRKTARMAGL